jgi:protein TonB
MADFQEADESKDKQKKMFIGVGVLALALIVGVSYLKFSSRQPVTPNQPVASQTASTPLASTAMKPAAATTATNSPVQPTTTADATPAPQPGLGKQSEMMNRQLNAPSKISNDLKALGASQPEPSSGFSATGMDGMGNSTPVFNSGNGPKVKVQAPTKVTISNGIAVGLLIQKTAPVYPPIAKSAHVQGTVVIQATISKAGAIVNSHVVAGPPMLRQAAQDAVQTWRFRPYLLDGQPVEVETTVSVVFNLGG